MLFLSFLFLVPSLAQQFVCPLGNGVLPPTFHGSAGGEALTLLATPTALFLTPKGDTVGTYYCILSAFVNPNEQKEIFITIGSLRNTPTDQDVTCAYLDLTKAPAAVVFNVSDPSGQQCPIKAGLPFKAWAPSSSAPALPTCPERNAPIPRDLVGQGTLKDAQQSGNSHLLLGGGAWTTVLQGALVTVQCVAAVAFPPGQPAGLAQLQLSNAAAGDSEACAWVLRKSASLLQYKLGKGKVCPTDFSGALTIPFVYNSTAAAP